MEYNVHNRGGGKGWGTTAIIRMIRILINLILTSRFYFTEECDGGSHDSLDFGTTIRGVNTVTAEKLHSLKTICSAKGYDRTPSAYGRRRWSC